ncbi:hypothetical protein BaRGS_00023409 [Batillaria attramentaria]|uniref:Uncharacterized protein n=1 Tax=Batillaria attramentaria TaxID=370345 RepID=A0ABD0JTR9_9CAEN
MPPPNASGHRHHASPASGHSRVRPSPPREPNMHGCRFFINNSDQLVYGTNHLPRLPPPGAWGRRLACFPSPCHRQSAAPRCGFCEYLIRFLLLDSVCRSFCFSAPNSSHCL